MAEITTIGSIFSSLGAEHGILAAFLTAICSICAIVGGLITQVINNRQKIKEIKLNADQKNFELTLDEAALIRKELRENFDRVQKELTLWQKRYYELKEENLKLRTELGALQTQVSDIKSRGWIPPDKEDAYQ